MYQLGLFDVSNIQLEPYIYIYISTLLLGLLVLFIINSNN